MTRAGAPTAAAGATLCLWCTGAQAHLASTGLGPLYDGISHLFLSIDDLLPVMAMALLAGLNGTAAGRRVLFVLPAAWLLGGLMGFHSGAALPAGTTSLSLLVLGSLVAADRQLGWPVVTMLAATLGLVHGVLNGAGIVAAGREVSGLVGITAAVFALTALLTGSVLSLRPPWTRIVVRVAGSWIAATGLLMLGWSSSGRN